MRFGFDLRSAVAIMRRRPITVYAIAYFVVLLSCIRIWSVDPTLLYIARDSDFSLWLAHAYREWAHPLGVTAFNPFQGMGSMLMPMNPYFNPGAWVFQTEFGLATKIVASMVVYFLEVTISCLLLGRALGFSWTFSFCASIWLVVLFLPPFNFLFSLQGVMATSPQWANALAISNLVLTLLVLIGKRTWSELGTLYAAAINIALATGMVALLLLCLLAAPFYNAGTLPGLVLLCAVVVLSSSNISQAMWRVGAGLYSLVIFYALGVFEFFVGGKYFTARFAKSGKAESSIPQFHLPVDLSQATWAAAQKWLCDAAVICHSVPFPSFASAYWLHTAVIVGGILVWIREPPPLARIGGGFALAWSGLLLFWLAQSLGVVTNVAISPIYIVVPLHSFWAFFSLFPMWLAVRFLWGKIAASMPPGVATNRSWVRLLAPPIAISLGFLAIAWKYGGRLSLASPYINYFPVRGAFESRKTGPIVDRLRTEIAIRPGEQFRGSVATILGVKGGSLRKVLGIQATATLALGEHEAFLNHSLAATGNDHTLLDMWWFNIPTLSEYAQGISRQFMFYVANFLSDPDDRHDVSVVILHRANVDVLRAMGVRFIIIDKVLSDLGTTLLVKESFRGADFYLYEVIRPNLGTYSPKRSRWLPT